MQNLSSIIELKDTQKEIMSINQVFFDFVIKKFFSNSIISSSLNTNPEKESNQNDSINKIINMNLISPPSKQNLNYYNNIAYNNPNSNQNKKIDDIKDSTNSNNPVLKNQTQNLSLPRDYKLDQDIHNKFTSAIQSSLFFNRKILNNQLNQNVSISNSLDQNINNNSPQINNQINSININNNNSNKIPSFSSLQPSPVAEDKKYIKPDVNTYSKSDKVNKVISSQKMNEYINNNYNKGSYESEGKKGVQELRNIYGFNYNNNSYNNNYNNYKQNNYGETVSPYYCPKHKRDYLTKKEYDHHIVTSHNNVNQIKQQQNTLGYQGYNSVIQYSNQPPFICQRCQKSFNSLSALQAHVEMHKNECKICKKIFSTHILMKEHLKTAHYVCCPKCNTKFKNSDKLKKHVKKMHPICCSSCNKKFSTEAGMKTHFKVVHGFEKRGPNDVYEENEEEEDDEGEDDDDDGEEDENEEEEEDDGNEDNYILNNNNNSSINCKICGKDFGSKQSLEQHWNSKHQFSCLVCKKSFGSKTAMDSHNKSKHNK